MRPALVMAVCCALAITFAHPQQAAKSTPSAANDTNSTANQLIGTWRLVSVETVRANGEIIYPYYGKHPEGLLMYDRNGWMSVQIVSDPKPSLPVASSREGFLAAPVSEKAAAIDGYYAYFGTWTVDSTGRAVTHHIRESLYPAERGEDGIRAIKFEGNRLTLTAKAHEMGEEHERRLVWERISTR